MLIGAGGQLGRAIYSHFEKNGEKVHGLSGREYAELSRSPSALEKRLEKTLWNADAYRFIFAHGLTLPSAPESELLLANFESAVNLIEGFEKVLSGKPARFFSFGTILERGDTVNAYVRSKRKLADWMTSRPESCLHIQLHTLYGVEEPKSHMFLGHMLRALRKKEEFRMSSGKQLREYHHVDDVAAGILRLVNHELPREKGMPPGAFGLHSGRALHLGVLAEEVWQELGEGRALVRGALPDAPSENYDIHFEATSPEIYPHAREAVTGVTEDLRRYL